MRGLVGGHPVLDLVNTVSWRPVPERRQDHLTDAAAVASWAVAARVVDQDTGDRLSSAGTGTDAAEAVRRLTELRERLHPVLAAIAQGRHPDRTAVEHLRDDLARALRRATPSDDLPLRWHVEVRHPADLVDALALQADELLRSPDLPRLGQCADTRCGWLFLDRTRSHSRRWCSSADCGNRDRARRHYTRTHG